MKRAVLALSLLLSMAAPAWTQDAKPNFSGSWSLDLAKSDFGPAPPPSSITAVIVHKEPTITITTTQKSSMGDTSNDRTLTTDGKDNINKLKTPAGDADLHSTSHWDGRKLITASSMDMQGTTIALNDVWELSDDGKVMTITRDVKTPQGDFTTKTVFNKQ